MYRLVVEEYLNQVNKTSPVLNAAVESIRHIRGLDLVREVRDRFLEESGGRGGINQVKGEGKTFQAEGTA